ncbi:MAG: hypothetical protein F6K25_31160 [Okeania sp. SIO2G4]|uniref:hypothetical protein n=1 Tax=Okeania sp. SIO2F5 TaxID=2607794 RepID=UPI0013B7CDD4|nr:hypothetical protein [Okeania sp. SIO2F5]NEQ94847.1 hypothetical protein [Okeania sp. SIO2G4]
MDNLSVHKSSKIRQAIESVGAKLVFLLRNCGYAPPLLSYPLPTSFLTSGLTKSRDCVFSTETV